MPGLLRGVARVAVIVGYGDRGFEPCLASPGRPVVPARTAAVRAAAGRSNRSTPRRRPPPSDAMDNKLEQLKQLADLKAQGVLTDAEFEAQKAKILAG